MDEYKIITVKLFGETVGWLDYHPVKENSYFEYNPEFSLKNNVSPLIMKPTKRLDETFYYSLAKDDFFEGLPPMIADSLPDSFGNDVLKSWLEKNNKLENFNPALRLAYIGNRGMGALEYEPYLFNELDKDKFNLDLKELADISNQIATSVLPEDFDKDKLRNLFLVGSTAGGVRAKAVVSVNFNSRQIINYDKSNDGFTPIIIKFDKPDRGNPDVSSQCGIVEYIYYKIATSLGINMTSSGLIKQDGFEHFYTRRFDRTPEGEKLHTQTYAAIKGVNPRIVLRNEGVFETMLQLRLNYNELEQQFKRVVFNLMASNDDCHAKNISFLMNKKGEWSLSPAYDITFPYELSKVWKKDQAMSINGKTKNITLNDLLILGNEFGIKGAKNIINDTAECLSGFKDMALKKKLSKENITTIDQYLIKDKLMDKNKGKGLGM